MSMNHRDIHPCRGRIPAYVLASLLLLQVLWGCDYARMKYDEAVNTYQVKMPPVQAGTVPFSGGVEELRQANPADLHNPIPINQASIDQGRLYYDYYCIQCHGAEADGYGTVGQSFVPLPTDLHTAYVQEQGDGDLFYRINFGFGKHPPLWYTVTPKECWTIVNYIKSL